MKGWGVYNCFAKLRYHFNKQLQRMGMREEKQKFCGSHIPMHAHSYLRYFTVKPTEGSRTVFQNTLSGVGQRKLQKKRRHKLFSSWVFWDWFFFFSQVSVLCTIKQHITFPVKSWADPRDLSHCKQSELLEVLSVFHPQSQCNSYTNN